jgi:hypothetical protein
MRQNIEGGYMIAGTINKKQKTKTFVFDCRKCGIQVHLCTDYSIKVMDELCDSCFNKKIVKALKVKS